MAFVANTGVLDTETPIGSSAHEVVESRYEVEGETKVKEKEPIIQEVVHPVEVEEVQPIVHRDRIKTEVHQIIQPVYVEETRPPEIIEREAVPEHRPTVYEDTSEYKKDFETGLAQPSTEYTKVKRVRVVKPPIVEEVIKRNITEVIQPVIHKEIIQPVIIHERQPIFEEVKEAPVVQQEIKEPVIIRNNTLNEELSQSDPDFTKIHIESTTVQTQTAL